jgi:hypothetical protein
MTPYDGDDLPPLDDAAIARISKAIEEARAKVNRAWRKGSPAIRGRIEWDRDRQMTAILPWEKQVRVKGLEERGTPAED